MEGASVPTLAYLSASFPSNALCPRIHNRFILLVFVRVLRATWQSNIILGGTVVVCQSRKCWVAVGVYIDGLSFSDIIRAIISACNTAASFPRLRIKLFLNLTPECLVLLCTYYSFVVFLITLFVYSFSYFNSSDPALTLGFIFKSLVLFSNNYISRLLYFSCSRFFTW